MFSFLCPKQFWTVHDETLHRSCRQTNFSEGGFVNKVPYFNFFVSFSYLLSFLFLTFSALSSFFKWVHSQFGGWGGGRESILGKLFAKTDSIVLNKVSTIAVKLIY